MGFLRKTGSKTVLLTILMSSVTIRTTSYHPDKGEI